MPDGGSINLRLSLQGAEQVRAELDKIGPAGSKMARDLDRAMRTPGPAMSALDAGVAHTRGSLDGLTQRTGALGAGLGALGPWGTAAAAALAAVAIAATAAIAQGREAMAFADEIDDAAEKLNVGTEALQEYRYAMTAVGGATSGADAAIEGFQKKLGDGIAGGKSLKWFERLGFGTEDLKAFPDTEKALGAVLDKISDLGTEAERAAVAEKLGLGPMVALARQGSDRLAELRQEARELGVVMDAELVRRGAEANQQFETMSRVIDVQLKSAFVDIAPVLVRLISLAASLAGALSNVADSWRKVENRSTEGLRQQALRLAERREFISDLAGDRPNPFQQDAINRLTAQRDRILEELRGRADRPAAGTPPSGQLVDVSSGGGGGGGGPSEAEQASARRRQDAEREVERLLQTDFAVQREWLQEVVAGRDTAAERANAARLLLGLDEEEARVALEKAEATIRSSGLADEEVEQRLAQIRTLRADVGVAARRAIEEREAQERREALSAAEEQYLQITGEILSLASSSARTSYERQAIELQILELSQRRQRADLLAAIQAEKEPEARARLVAALDRLPALFEAQAAEVRRRSAGPLGQWRDSQMQGPGEASEWLQGEALDALDGVNDGLIDAFRNAENAEDAFERMGQVAVDALGQIADALLKVAIQRTMIEPLVNALFGGSTGSGTGGLLGNLIGSFAGNLFGGGVGGSGAGKLPQKLYGAGKARGGLQGATGWTPVGERGMELIDLPVGSRVFDADTTQRTLLDFDARMRAMATDGGARRAPTINMPINIVNRTSEPVQARTTRAPGGGFDVVLEPAVRSAVARMGADGSLAQAHGLTPRPIRRG